MASVAVPVGFNTTRTCRSLGVARKNPANNHRPRRTLHISSIFPLRVSEDAVPHSVVYRRSSFQTHFECETSLESLGLKQFSTDLTRSLTTSMGLSRKISETETPVGVSYDVSKDKKSGDLTLNGIVKTAVCVLCDRCLSPHGAKIFSPFTLLLSRTPVEEPKEQTIGVVLGEEPEPGEPVLDIDLDDKIFFSDEVKSIDISAYIRDTVHLEVPYFSLCSSSCKGLCTHCGLNINTSECTCEPEDLDPMTSVKYKAAV